MDFDYLFAERYYEGLEGGILEAFGKLFSDNTNVYVYPTIRDGKLITLENIEVDSSLEHLLKYLIHNKAMVSSDIEDVRNLEISAREVITELSKGRGGWEDKLPSKTVDSIIENKLFGFVGE